MSLLQMYVATIPSPPRAVLAVVPPAIIAAAATGNSKDHHRDLEAPPVRKTTTSTTRARFGSLLEEPAEAADAAVESDMRNLRFDSDFTTKAVHEALMVGRVGGPTWKPRVVQLVNMRGTTAAVSADRNFVPWITTLRQRRRYVEALFNESAMANETTADDSVSSADDKILPFARRFYDECVPMVPWQSLSFPVCNMLHEIDVAHQQRGGVGGNDTTVDDVSLLSTQGSWRSVWKLHRSSWLTNETVVLKLLQHNHREFDQESYEHHRVDALAMERLTKSRHIVDIYGYCGQSVLTELATGSARAFVKNKSLTSLQRLETGRDMAQAVADLHSIDYADGNNVTLTHNDMNVANAVTVRGRIKLNDFNIGILQRWNATAHRVCHTPVLFAAPLWKSPEENANVSYVDAAATDVYGLGNLLFHVLTKCQPWTHLEPNGPLTKMEAAERKMAGGQPFVPAKYRAESSGPNGHANSTSSGAAPPPPRPLAYAALHHAVAACFRTDPRVRPTAQQLARQLDTAVQWIRAQQQPQPQPRRGSSNSSSSSKMIRPADLERLFAPPLLLS